MARWGEVCGTSGSTSRETPGRGVRWGPTPGRGVRWSGCTSVCVGPMDVRVTERPPRPTLLGPEPSRGVSLPRIVSLWGWGLVTSQVEKGPFRSQPT